MFNFEVFAVLLTIFGLALGVTGICWARSEGAAGLARWGRRLYVATLLVLGCSSLVAAIHRAEGLVLLGLSAGTLVIGMLFEGPQHGPAPAEPASLPEET